MADVLLVIDAGEVEPALEEIVGLVLEEYRDHVVNHPRDVDHCGSLLAFAAFRHRGRRTCFSDLPAGDAPTCQR